MIRLEGDWVKNKENKEEKERERKVILFFSYRERKSVM